MHMVSYAGRADLQILVAKEIIPDPQVLAKCFEEALLEMKEAAEAATKEWCENFFPDRTGCFKTIHNTCKRG